MNTQYNCKYAFDTISKLIDKYHQYGYVFVLDWETRGYYHPRYDQKIEVVTPVGVAEFVH